MSNRPHIIDKEGHFDAYDVHAFAEAGIRVRRPRIDAMAISIPAETQVAGEIMRIIHDRQDVPTQGEVRATLAKHRVDQQSAVGKALIDLDCPPQLMPLRHRVIMWFHGAMDDLPQ